MRHIPVLTTRTLALDILNGKDDIIDFEDFLGGNFNSLFLFHMVDAKTPLESVSPHTVMEQVLGL